MSDLGEVVPLGVVVRDEAGQPMNAEDVTLTITRPDETTTVLSVLNPPLETGRYRAEIVPTSLYGLYRYRWQTTRPDTAFEGVFNVERPGSVGILSLAEAKELLGMQADDRYDDAILRTLRSATNLAERVRGEKILRQPVSETRDLGATPARGLALVHRPIISLTAVHRLGDAGVVLETLAPPLVGVTEAGILTSGDRYLLWGRLRIEYIAGYAAPPPEYRDAVGYILQALWTNRRGAGGRPRVGGQATGGGEGAADTRSVPAQALDLLGADRARPLVG